MSVEYIAIGVTVAIAVIGLIVGLVNWIVNNKDRDFETVKTKQHELELKVHNTELAMARLENKILQELGKIKANYLERFDGITSTLNKHHEESILSIEKINSGIEKQQQFCFLIQEQKKSGHSES